MSVQVGEITAFSGAIQENTSEGIFGQLDVLINWLNQYASVIVFIWLLVVCVKGFWFSLSLRNLQTLRHRRVFSAGSYWENRVTALSAELGIREKVQIVQSALAQTPMVIGYFKPIILMPIGLLAGLPAAQIESIIYHELAHIKRRDYLVNIVQSLLEILFFFNPAVLWVSNRIKIERENCCDDLAVDKVKSKKDYIKALVSCAEYGFQTPALALHFSDEKDPLLKRVQRILSKEEGTFTKIEKAFLTLGIISLMLVFTAFQSYKNNNPTEKTAIQTETEGTPSLVPDPDLGKRKSFILTGVTGDSIPEEAGKDTEEVLNKMIMEMFEDQLIAEKEGLSFKLSKDSLIINGLEANGDFRKKYQNKYLKNKDWTYAYNYRIEYRGYFAREGEVKGE